MRFSQTPPSLISLLLVALSQINTVNAGPFPKDPLHDLLGLGWLQPRDCVSYCGAQNQYCCTAGQACFTNAANVAYCSAGGATAGYGVYTTTWTETDLVTRTSTYSSYYQVATTTQTWASVGTSPAICTTSLGESSCGTICCAENQRCAYAGSCTAYTSTFVATSTYSAPLRPTSGGVSTQTSVVSATTTAPFISPATASGSTLPITSASSGGGLSAGAIAGIVIGVIAGVILLLLLCFCCLARSLFDGILSIFGLGKKRRDRDRRTTERVEVVERYSRHGSGTASRRDTHSGWFGGGGGRPARVVEERRTEKKSGGLGGLGMVGVGLLGLAGILGLKRREDKKKSVAARSDMSSSYYTDSYTGTSASE